MKMLLLSFFVVAVWGDFVLFYFILNSYYYLALSSALVVFIASKDEGLAFWESFHSVRVSSQTKTLRSWPQILRQQTPRQEFRSNTLK